MDTEKIKRNREYSERAFWTGHYHFLMQALAVAMSRCLVWRLVGVGTPYTLKDLFDFAKIQDEEHELKDPYFYYVSREGAIGLSPGLEYLTQWLFIPMEPGKERDFFLRDLREKILEEEAAEMAVNQAVDDGLARERQNATQYMVFKDGQQTGPYTIRQLMHQQLSPDTLVWSQGMETWTPAGQVVDIASALGYQPSPSQPQAQPEAQVQASSQPETDEPVKYYMIDSNNQRLGPLTIIDMLNYGLTSDTLVWTDGMSQWARAAEVAVLNDLLRRYGR